MKDDSPTVRCAYCGEEIENKHGFSSYGLVGYHEPCAYEWDVEEWCGACMRAICTCKEDSDE
jgi:hypothetical protein